MKRGTSIQKVKFHTKRGTCILKGTLPYKKVKFHTKGHFHTKGTLQYKKGHLHIKRGTYIWKGANPYIGDTMVVTEPFHPENIHIVGLLFKKTCSLRDHFWWSISFVGHFENIISFMRPFGKSIYGTIQSYPFREYYWSYMHLLKRDHFFSNGYHSSPLVHTHVSMEVPLGHIMSSCDRISLTLKYLQWNHMPNTVYHMDIGDRHSDDVNLAGVHSFQGLVLSVITTRDWCECRSCQ